MNKLTKIQQVKNALLQGKTLSGKEIMTKYHYLSYRDVIYYLRRQGLLIDTRLVGRSKHALYSVNTEAIEQYQSQQRAMNRNRKESQND